MSKFITYQVERKDYLFYVRAAIGGKDDRSKVVRLLVDTGARKTVLPVNLLQECGYNINTPIRRTRVTAAGGILHVPIMEIAWFNCLGTKLQAFQAIALDLPHSAGTDGLLGMDFLTEIGAIINIEKMRIIVPQKR